jgi:hypothetical protein
MYSSLHLRTDKVPLSERMFYIFLIPDDGQNPEAQ